MSTEYFKNWWNENQEKYRDYMKTPIICECGATVTRGSKSTHTKTKKHLRLMKIVEQDNLEIRIKKLERRVKKLETRKTC